MRRPDRPDAENPRLGRGWQSGIGGVGGGQATFRLMKHYTTLILALFAAGIAQAQTSPHTEINTESCSVSRMLSVYSTFSGKQLVIEPSATNQLKTITMHMMATNALTQAECAKVIESELRKQADIVITPLDDKRASVTLSRK
jgi:hypothetical protein